MSKTKIALSAIVAAVAIYAAGFIILGFFYEPKCRTIDEHWWGSISRCRIEVPLK